MTAKNGTLLKIRRAWYNYIIIITASPRSLRCISQKQPTAVIGPMALIMYYTISVFVFTHSISSILLFADHSRTWNFSIMGGGNVPLGWRLIDITECITSGALGAWEEIHWDAEPRTPKDPSWCDNWLAIKSHKVLSPFFVCEIMPCRGGSGTSKGIDESWHDRPFHYFNVFFCCRGLDLTSSWLFCFKVIFILDNPQIA